MPLRDFPVKVWLNGQVLDGSAARIAPDDRGLLLGDGVFETLAVRDGAPLRVAAHLDRLTRSCEALDLPPPYSHTRLSEALAQVTLANRLEHGALRLTVTRGSAPRGLRPPAEQRPTVLISAAASTVGAPAPATAVIAQTVRRNEHSPLSRIKSLNYLDGVLAQIEAARRGADDALLLNTAGFVAEATIANVFVVLGQHVVTPRPEDGVLPGIMRAAVIDATGAEEAPISPSDLAAASEVFLSNVSGVVPVVRIDEEAVGDGQPGPVWRGLGGLILGRDRP